MSWAIDFSGKLEDVIEHVKTVQLSRDQLKQVALVEECSKLEKAEEREEFKTQLGEMDTATLRELLAEHIGDFDCYRRIVLDELYRCRFPYAGVYCAWEDAPQHLGGYGIRLHVSGYEKSPT